MHRCMASLHAGEDRVPLTLNGRAIGSKLMIQPSRLNLLLAGRHIGSQRHPHAKGHHAEINTYPHRRSCHSATV